MTDTSGKQPGSLPFAQVFAHLQQAQEVLLASLHDHQTEMHTHGAPAPDAMSDVAYEADQPSKLFRQMRVSIECDYWRPDCPRLYCSADMLAAHQD